MLNTAHQPAEGFAGFLKNWRTRRRISQLDLSLQAGLSQRHISFLETGRSKPSRSAINQLGQALEMPAAEIDAMLVAAGFAAPSSNARWGEQTRHAVAASIEHVLQGHNPYPAVSVDRLWSIQSANQSAQTFFAALGGNGDPNILRSIMSPGNLRSSISNWHDVCRALYRLFELEVARRPNDTQAKALLEELHALEGVADAIRAPYSDNPSPVLAIEFNLAGATLNLFSMIATIGMSSDAAIDDIRIETLLPADNSTREWFQTGNPQD